MSQKEYDLVVIGGSLGGCQTALTAAKNDLTVAIIEENRIGGLKTFASDLPIEIFIDNLNLINNRNKLKQKGLESDKFYFNPKDFYSYLRNKTNLISEDLVKSLKEAKVDIYIGRAQCYGQKQIQITRDKTNNREIHYRKLVYAKDPITKVPELIQNNVNGYYTLENFGLLNRIPEKLIIFGYGDIAYYLSLFWSCFGCKVDLICPKEVLIKGVNPSYANYFISELKHAGVNCFIGYKLEDIYQDSSGNYHLEITGKEPHSLSCSHLIVLTETQADLSGLGYLQLKTKENFIVVNDYLESSDPNLLTWLGSNLSQKFPQDLSKASQYLGLLISQKVNYPYQSSPEEIFIKTNPGYLKIGKLSENRNSTKDEEIELIVSKDKEYDQILGFEAFGNSLLELREIATIILGLEGLSEDILSLSSYNNSILDILKRALNKNE